jgi:hypothetical protein
MNSMLNFNQLTKPNNTFITNNLCTGIDNIYIGNIYTMSALSSMFHNNLEEIVKKYSYLHNQEYYVYYINNDDICINYNLPELSKHF